MLCGVSEPWLNSFPLMSPFRHYYYNSLLISILATYLLAHGQFSLR